MIQPRSHLNIKEILLLQLTDCRRMEQKHPDHACPRAKSSRQSGQQRQMPDVHRYWAGAVKHRLHDYWHEDMSSVTMGHDGNGMTWVVSSCLMRSKVLETKMYASFITHNMFMKSGSIYMWLTIKWSLTHCARIVKYISPAKTRYFLKICLSVCLSHTLRSLSTGTCHRRFIIFNFINSKHRSCWAWREAAGSDGRSIESKARATISRLTLFCPELVYRRNCSVSHASTNDPQ